MVFGHRGNRRRDRSVPASRFCVASTLSTPSGCSSRPWAGPPRRSALRRQPTAGRPVALSWSRPPGLRRPYPSALEPRQVPGVRPAAVGDRGGQQVVPGVTVAQLNAQQPRAGESLIPLLNRITTVRSCSGVERRVQPRSSPRRTQLRLRRGQVGDLLPGQGTDPRGPGRHLPDHACRILTGRTTISGPSTSTARWFLCCNVGSTFTTVAGLGEVGRPM
jgi:hypothetical protein